jgi:hypothetical protein
MTAAVVALALLALALVVVLVVRERDHARERQEDAALHRGERRELTTRIQRPEWIPAPPRDFKPAELPTDAVELATIGTVVPFREPGDDDNAEEA